MLAAVCVMAATRTQTPQQASDFQEGSTEAESAVETQANEDQEVCSHVSNISAGSSLLSFAAAEFAQVPTPVRQRRADATSSRSPDVVTLGAVMAIASV
mmetsp:Transcript_57606/g.154296  ORF Transcript_57606/g.154296 Transcript_57606/m.154296 type:complete len:99 (+) Transcript_57606:3-299(+)